MQRRSLIGGLAALPLGAAPFSARAANDVARELAGLAKTRPPVLWSESSDAAGIAKVIAAFNEDWPDIKVEFIRDTGGNTLAAKALQEAQSGGTPAALLTGDAGQFAALEQRGLLAAVTWDSLGADASLPQTATMIATTSALGVLVWNRANVSDAEAPKSLDDLLQPRFAGKLGSWIRAPLYASLAKRQGVDKVAAWLTNLLGQQPKLYDSTYRLAQDVGTGEIDVGYGLYHATLPAIAAGAPIGMALTEPVAISTLFSAVVNRGANTEGARLLAAWLATPKGANAYEAGTGRGNPYVAGSKTGDYVKGHVLSEYPVGELAAYVKTLTEFNKMLSSRGARK